MSDHNHVAWAHMEAERAFAQAARARRRASLARRLFRRPPAALLVHDQRTLAGRRATRAGVQEIPLDAITGTLEPGRAREFDHDFRPARRARRRWLRVWLAEHTGAGLPPIDVIQIGDGYAIRDGHHRVSVARARGAVAIDPVVT